MPRWLPAFHPYVYKGDIKVRAITWVRDVYTFEKIDPLRFVSLAYMAARKLELDRNNSIR